MRYQNFGLVAALIALPALSAPVVGAGSNYKNLNAAGQTLDWRDDGRELILHSTLNDVIVAKTQPDSLFGLKTGDVIRGLDNGPVRNVPELIRKLSQHSHSPVTFYIKRGPFHDLVTVTIGPKDYENILPPARTVASSVGN